MTLREREITWSESITIFYIFLVDKSLQPIATLIFCYSVIIYFLVYLSMLLLFYILQIALFFFVRRYRTEDINRTWVVEYYLTITFSLRILSCRIYILF